MDAAAAFDRGQARLDALVDVVPDDLRGSATGYRDVFEGYRSLILPSTTLDADTYEHRFDELRAEQEATRAELEVQLAERCSSP